MASTARIFFAGVATTFAILAGGFGAGLMLAKSAFHEPPPRIRASSEAPSGVRVILPASAEPALQVTRAAPQPDAQPVVQPAKEVQASIKQVEQVDTRQAERDARAERRKQAQAERRARRHAARARQQVEPQNRQEPGIMAFGGDGPSLFGN
jgi:hypothetical protein